MRERPGGREAVLDHEDDPVPQAGQVGDVAAEGDQVCAPAGVRSVRITDLVPLNGVTPRTVDHVG
ncbi:hypothetical protein ACFQ08_44605, partial [Streptosporangium algeriense]